MASGWGDLTSSVAHAIDAFVGAAYSLAAVRRVAARSRGPHVDFLVTVDGPWHEAIADLEPRLRQLRIEGTTSFDYTVVPAEWGEPDPPGYVAVFAR
ncbi:MAG: hypothetical protein A2X23_02495 [Chloroflexi bacterium GWC2_73_18]|nr:MAG: hypothetical protein A2X23_02495 [Chloroflexi bacterium GWC2_73_18]